MYYGTDELNQIIDTPNGKALSLRMTFEDGTEITSFKKLRYSGGSNSSNDIAIGTTLSAYVDVTLFDEHNLTNQEFLLEQGAMLQDGTMEYVPIGYFTVQRPNSEDETVDFVAYDRMTKFIKPYVSELTYPTTSDKVLKEVCDMCGVELATTITNPITIESKLDGYLCREVLGFISALHGSFACIDRFGKVNVRWYENEPISKELVLVYALDKAQDDYVVEKIEVHKNAETSFTSGSGTRTMYNSNPYATQDSTNAIASKIGGFTYNPSKITMLDDIRLDPWDIVKVVNLDGNEVLIPCMQIEHDFTRGQTSIKSVGATETQTQYNYQGPTVEFMNRMAAELLVVNRIVAKSVTTDYLEANYVSTKELDVVEANIKNAVIEDLSTEFADIHLANIDIADIGTFFADSGILDKVVIENGAVTGELKGVRIVGDVIEANTIKADSLILSGSEDSLIYQINVNSSGLSLEELSDEVYKEKLSGTDLVAKSVTTNELNVDEIFGNSAVLNTITSQEIFSNAVATNRVVVGASNSANTALSTANTASNNANSALSTANTANNTANATKRTLDSLCVLENNVTVIDGGKIYTGSITADKIDVDDLFAQDITATGTITGATLKGAHVEANSGNIGKLTIDEKGVLVANQEVVSIMSDTNIIKGRFIERLGNTTEISETSLNMSGFKRTETRYSNDNNNVIQFDSLDISRRYISWTSTWYDEDTGDEIDTSITTLEWSNYSDYDKTVLETSSIFKAAGIISDGSISAATITTTAGANLDTVNSRTTWRTCAVAASTTYGTFAAAPYAKYRYDENILEIVLIMGTWTAKATVAEGQPLCRITGLNVSIPHNSTCQVWDDSGQIYRRLTLGTDGYVKLSSNTSIPTNYWLSFDNIRFTMRRT